MSRKIQTGCEGGNREAEVLAALSRHSICLCTAGLGVLQLT